MPVCGTRFIQQIAGSKQYGFRVGPKPTLPPEVVTAASLEYAANINPGLRSINISQLLFGSVGPGLAFRVTESPLCALIEEVSKVEQGIALSETAGLLQLQFKDEPLKLAKKLIHRFFTFEQEQGKVNMQTLSEIFTLRRRYFRSINLERDLDNPESVLGYVPTPRSCETLERLLNAFNAPRAGRAWTITGAYGTGKSAFVHFLASLCAPKGELAHKYTSEIIREVHSTYPGLRKHLNELQSDKGFVRAVATAQREPVAHTIVRALHKGASLFWSDGKGRLPEVVDKVDELYERVLKGSQIDDAAIPELVYKLAAASKQGFFS